MLSLIKMIKTQDPAIRNAAEILIYPGLWAMGFHKISHRLYRWRLFLPSTLIAQIARFLTGIEIHPGAQLASEVFIDHGTGVVIGETCQIGRYVTIYQGVTLGGTGKNTGKRHPTIGDNVTIGAGASVLGPISVGQNSKIGANTVVLRDVLPDTTVVGEQGRDVHCEASLRREIEAIKRQIGM